MRLSKIKLAGFKSFVDPTTFHLPSNLVGIVGPNGCGKSNVIDAVRWVMGEMSAKHLRGDSMADVIFNGSSSRKPVGTASIELYFDNSDGSIGGQYAQYAEISIKRMISRDGTSSYFLNNTRCRRKDITDLFLGTGLGSRSYAIIEQGMVSRLVEAKPDEMRIYIEEAAGISKYKERRRETESRIQHTRDNLARLNDLREEIGKQLDSLQRQAKVAERYKEHKARERRLEAELLAMRLADIDRTLEGSRSELARRETELEAAIARQRHVESVIVSARERHHDATESFNAIQARHYAVQSEISRLEQAIAHARETRDRHLIDKAQTCEQSAALEAEIARDREQLLALESQVGQLEPRLRQARETESAAALALQSAEAALEKWQQEWHDFNAAVGRLEQAMQVEQTRIEHLEAQRQQLRRQQQSLASERDSIVLIELDSRASDLDAAEAATAERARSLESRLAEIESETETLRRQEREVGAELERITGELASQRGQVTALQAVQRATFGLEEDSLVAWLAARELDKAPRLAQQLRVAEPWILAVETVLGDFLQALCVDDCLQHLAGLPDSPVTLLSAGSAEFPARGTLLAHVSAPGQAASILANVHTADSLEEAVGLLATLQPHQSVITPDGIWLGPGWVRVNRGQRNASGFLAREHELRALQESIAAHETSIAALESTRRDTRSRLAGLEQLRGYVTQEFNAANREHAEVLANRENLRQEVARARDRHGVLDKDVGEMEAESERLAAAIAEATERASLARAESASLMQRRPALQRSQEELVAACRTSRETAERHRTEVNKVTVEFESRRVALESARAGLLRLETQRAGLAERVSVLEQQIAGADPLIERMQAELSTQLEEQLLVDRSLAEQRDALEQADAALRAGESERSSAEKAVAECREGSEGIRMQVRELEIRRETIMEQFAATGAQLEAVMREMPAEAEPGRWQEALEEVRRKIERLGPINLAAIEQFNEQSERKKYLDAQNDDLTAALDTLEQAIRRIDRETRSRFQETFDQINQGLKRIFPRLFGGGHAYLTLEGDDVLSAGVTVMAQPPGKRNSHIHLLSGGEKALTAVALIFSIFELNPAPFCLLDEVDAPLDEANVGRFCEIVNEMAQRVQFVVITHNKTTMEMVNQLTGVTMNEPGVSRLVSVDLDAAVQLAAS
jgi:chromosome segregation protein